MGTTYMVKVRFVDPPSDASKVSAVIKATLVEVNDQMSTYQADSELSRFNASKSDAPFSVSPQLIEVVAKAQELAKLSGGAFDVTVGPLVNAWGFGPSDVEAPPSPDEIKALLKTVGHDKLHYDVGEKTLKKDLPSLYVDLSAIAKGFGVDRIAAELEAIGFEDFMVEIGGEVRAKGVNESGSPWQIGIEKPSEGARQIQEVVSLDSMAMATSGSYRNFYEKDGERVSHTIDATTGFPIKHRLASVTVVHPDCMSADGLATALSVLGLAKGLSLAKKEGLAALFIVKETDGSFTETTTPAFEALRAPKAKRE
jgi:thiamine biosynthesis lipoprotein